MHTLHLSSTLPCPQYTNPIVPRPLSLISCPLTDFDAALKAVESEFSAAEKELGGTCKKAEEAAAAMKELELKDTKVGRGIGWGAGEGCGTSSGA